MLQAEVVSAVAAVLPADLPWRRSRSEDGEEYFTLSRPVGVTISINQDGEVGYAYRRARADWYLAGAVDWQDFDQLPADLAAALVSGQGVTTTS